MVQDVIIFALFNFYYTTNYGEKIMLKSHEIKALSDKLNYDLETTKNCLKILFSENSSTIDNNVVYPEDVDEFLRICIESKNKKVRDRLFYTSILQNLAKKACQNEKGNQIKTIVYLIRDNFFSAILAYLDAIEGKKFNQKFERVIIGNLDTFYFTMPDDYMNYPKLNRKKSDIVDNLLSRILDEIDLRDYQCSFEQEYVVKLSTKLVQEVGFQMFVADMIRDSFVDLEELGRHKKMLNIASKGLVSYRKDTKGEYIFIFCLCETLRNKGYKMEDAYKLLNQIENKADTSIRRRYYQLKAEMKKKGINYNDLIRQYGLGRRINLTIEEMNKISVS